MSDLPPTPARRITAGAVLGDRIETAGLNATRSVSTVAWRFAPARTASSPCSAMASRSLSACRRWKRRRSSAAWTAGSSSHSRIREESVQIEIAPDKDDQLTPSGIIVVKALTTEHTLLIADALATSVILAHDEKNVAAVFDVIQPIARELAEHGRTPGGRRSILKHIGNALLVQHRVSGLVAVAEKPDVLWERPALERFYARLDEYELKERADVLTRKLTVISEFRQGVCRHHRHRAIGAAGADYRRAHRPGNRDRRLQYGIH